MRRLARNSNDCPGGAAKRGVLFSVIRFSNASTWKHDKRAYRFYYRTGKYVDYILRQNENGRLPLFDATGRKYSDAEVEALKAAMVKLEDDNMVWDTFFSFPPGTFPESMNVTGDKDEDGELIASLIQEPLDAFLQSQGLKQTEAFFAIHADEHEGGRRVHVHVGFFQTAKEFAGGFRRKGELSREAMDELEANVGWNMAQRAGFAWERFGWQPLIEARNEAYAAADPTRGLAYDESELAKACAAIDWSKDRQAGGNRDRGRKGFFRGLTYNALSDAEQEAVMRFLTHLTDKNPELGRKYDAYLKAVADGRDKLVAGAKWHGLTEEVVDKKLDEAIFGKDGLNARLGNQALRLLRRANRARRRDLSRLGRAAAKRPHSGGGIRSWSSPPARSRAMRWSFPPSDGMAWRRAFADAVDWYRESFEQGLYWLRQVQKQRRELDAAMVGAGADAGQIDEADGEAETEDVRRSLR